MSRIGVILVLTLLLSSCGQSGADLSFKIRDGLSDGDRKIAENGLVAFTKACPGIVRYWGDLQQFERVSIQEASVTAERERGWKRVVAIRMQVADKPETVPSSYHAQGHRCFFDVGVGQQGVEISKSACISLCRNAPAKEPYMLVYPN